MGHYLYAIYTVHSEQANCPTKVTLVYMEAITQ